MHLICGLGNPGKQYKYTRHNIGFRIIDSIVSEFDFKEFKFDKSNECYKGKIRKNSCFLLKPQKYMNNSGDPIWTFATYYKVNIENIIIIHDDLDIDFGKIKYKSDGSNGGHRGLISIDKILGTKYNRVRFGISHPGKKNLVDSYVLKKFNKKEEILLDNIINSLLKNFYLLLDNKKDLFLTNTSIEIKKIKEKYGL